MAETVQDVVWVAPETVRTALREQAVRRHEGDAEALLRALEEVDRAPGEYRLAPDDGEVVPGIPGHSVRQGVAQVSKPGALVVWIDDTPDDPDDPSGHFEAYDAAAHGEPYAPIPSRRGAPYQAAPAATDDELEA